jgi:FlaA1/EpsC-like NDP-sugar epimerase
LDKLFQRQRFDVIASFAAHKHVRSEKDILAIEAMFQNNVFNTWKLLRLAYEHKPDRVFLVSTDKASNPANIMGGTKKLMESIILSMASDLHVATARFANVAFSNGSLLDGFRHRISQGQPLTAPSDVKRYFVTPSESGEICMLATFVSQSGDIIFPKIPEEQMKTFSSIADAFLTDLGMQPDYCGSEEEAKQKASTRSKHSLKYPVYYFPSDTSGEKPYEEFYTESETIDEDFLQALGVVRDPNPWSPILSEQMVNDFRNLFSQESLSKAEIVELMTGFIPGFQHLETGKNLDSRM